MSLTSRAERSSVLYLFGSQCLGWIPMETIGAGWHSQVPLIH